MSDRGRGKRIITAVSSNDVKFMKREIRKEYKVTLPVFGENDR